MEKQRFYNATIKAGIASFVFMAIAGAAVLFLGELVAKIPNIYVMILGGVLVAVMVSVTFSILQNKKDEFFDANREKFNDGLLVAIAPRENYWNNLNSELEEFLTRYSKFYAIRKGNSVICFMIRQNKKGEIVTARERRFSVKGFYKNFIFSDEETPQNIKLQ